MMNMSAGTVLKNDLRHDRRTKFLAFMVLAAGGVAVLLWPNLVRTPFSTAFLPHTYCFLMDRGLVLTHAVSDSLIGGSYLAISLTLVWLVYKSRRAIPFSWMFNAFGTFILACGLT